MAAHAVLSASGSHRWLNCPPSARLEQKFPDRAGESAQEGTFAHEWAEMALRNHFCRISSKDYKKYLARAKQSQWYSPSFEDYVGEYVSMVIEKAGEKNADLLLEQRLDYSDWVPEGFGRGDAVIVYEDRLEVCDLKFGRNVPVSAENNSQLRLYGLGAYSVFSFLVDDLKSVQMTICQPRNGGISTEVLPVDKLLEWGESIKPVADLAFKGEGSTCAGDWCQFCKAAPRCRRLAEYNMLRDKELFKDPDLLDDAEMAELLARVDGVKNYVTRVKDYAYKEALNGREWPGWKLVEGRANRQYSDEDAIAKVLEENGLQSVQFMRPPALKGITDLEKLLGKKNFSAMLDDYVVRPEGKPVLVPESDARPAIGNGDRYFEDLGE